MPAIVSSPMEKMMPENLKNDAKNLTLTIPQILAVSWPHSWLREKNEVQSESEDQEDDGDEIKECQEVALVVCEVLLQGRPD